jgi:hypothetical protein
MIGRPPVGCHCVYFTAVRNMTTEEFIFYTGSFAGIFSLIWMMGTQIFGTYDSRTIRNVLADHNKTLNEALKRLESIMKETGRGRK